MKNLKVNIWSLFLAAVLISISQNSFSQEKDENRQERKEMRKSELLANFNAIDSLLKARIFVLEADFLDDGIGDRISVISTINFIRVDTTSCVMQTGNDSRLGLNGVGGVTAEGTIGSWKVTKNTKSLSYMVHFTVTTNIGSYDVMMNIGADNRASAVVTGLTPGKLIFDGYLVALYNSRVFKGRNRI